MATKRKAGIMEAESIYWETPTPSLDAKYTRQEIAKIYMDCEPQVDSRELGLLIDLVDRELGVFPKDDILMSLRSELLRCYKDRW